MRHIPTCVQAVLINLVLGLVTVSSSHAQTPRQIAQRTFPSVVLVVMEDAGGKPISMGSGFFVRDDVVATSFHVIESGSRGYVKMVSQQGRYDVAGTVGIDRQRDLALLKVTGVKTAPLTLGDASQVAVGDEVYAVGNPEGFEGTFSQGIVSGIRHVESGTVFQITAPVSKGSSGGPVLDSRGRVIGVAFATIEGGQNLNFAVPASYLIPLFAHMTPVTPLTKSEPSHVSADDRTPKTIKGKDGGEMVLIWAGDFVMGSHESDPYAYEDEKPPHKIHLDAYYINKYEVTNTLYKRFIEATGRAVPHHWNNYRLNFPSQPVVGVTWHDAEEYCKWAGKRLPTEAEWEKAARGPDGRRYPWGEQWTLFGESKSVPRRANGNGQFPQPVPVGSYPEGVSPYGVHDMAGNVAEFVADFYDKEYYKKSPSRNPKGALLGPRVLRGGSWNSPERNLRVTDRGAQTRFKRTDTIGFRCVMGLSP